MEQLLCQIHRLQKLVEPAELIVLLKTYNELLEGIWLLKAKIHHKNNCNS